MTVRDYDVSSLTLDSRLCRNPLHSTTHYPTTTCAYIQTICDHTVTLFRLALVVVKFSSYPKYSCACDYILACESAQVLVDQELARAVAWYLEPLVRHAEPVPTPLLIIIALSIRNIIVVNLICQCCHMV